jgi:hypothetical protein
MYNITGYLQRLARPNVKVIVAAEIIFADNVKS